MFRMQQEQVKAAQRILGEAGSHQALDVGCITEQSVGVVLEPNDAPREVYNSSQLQLA